MRCVRVGRPPIGVPIGIRIGLRIGAPIAVLVGILIGGAIALAAIPAAAAPADRAADGSVTAPAPAQPAGWPPSVATLEDQMLAKINAQRAAVGAPAVQVQPWARTVAQAHSRDMVAADNLFHNLAGYMQVGRQAMGATELGENVGMDSTLDSVDALLYSDPPHRAITLDARFNYVGIGIALTAQNWVYLTEDFSQIPGGARAAAPATQAIAPPATTAVAKAAPKATASTSHPAAVLPAALVRPVPAVRSVAPPAATPSAGAAPVAAGVSSPPGEVPVLAARPVRHAPTPNAGVVMAAAMVGLVTVGGVGWRLATPKASPPRQGWRPTDRR